MIRDNKSLDRGESLRFNGDFDLALVQKLLALPELRDAARDPSVTKSASREDAEVFRAAWSLTGGHRSIVSLSRAAEDAGGDAALQLYQCAKLYQHALPFIARTFLEANELSDWHSFTSFERTYRPWLLRIAAAISKDDNVEPVDRDSPALRKAFVEDPERFTRWDEDFRFGGAVAIVLADPADQIRILDNGKVFRAVCEHSPSPRTGIACALKLDLDKVGNFVAWASDFVKDGIVQLMHAIHMTAGVADSLEKFEAPIRFFRSYSGNAIQVFGDSLPALDAKDTRGLYILLHLYGKHLPDGLWLGLFKDEIAQALPHVDTFRRTFGSLDRILVKALGLEAFLHIDRLGKMVSAIRERFMANDTMHDFRNTLGAITIAAVRDTTDTGLEILMESGSSAVPLRTFMPELLRGAAREEARWVTKCAGPWTGGVLEVYPRDFVAEASQPLRRLMSVTRRGLIPPALMGVAKHLTPDTAHIIDAAIDLVGSHAWGAIRGAGVDLVRTFESHPRELDFVLRKCGAGAGHYFDKVPLCEWFSDWGLPFVDRYGVAAGQEYDARWVYPEIEDSPAFRGCVDMNREHFGIRFPSRYCTENKNGTYHWDLLEDNLESLDPAHEADLPPCVVLVSTLDDGKALTAPHMLKSLSGTHKRFIFEVGSVAEIERARRTVESVVTEGGNPLDDRCMVVLLSHGNLKFVPLAPPPDVAPGGQLDLDNADWALTRTSMSIFSAWTTILPPKSRFLVASCNFAQGGFGGDNLWNSLRDALPEVYVNGSRVASNFSGLRKNPDNGRNSFKFGSPRRYQVIGSKH